MNPHARISRTAMVSTAGVPPKGSSPRQNANASTVPEAAEWWGADFILMSKWIGKYKKH